MKQDIFTLAYQRYRTGYEYNNQLKYYSTVSENLDYLIGEQWGSLSSSTDMPLVVLNFEKMVQRYKVAAISAQNLIATYTVENVSEETDDLVEQQLNDMAKAMAGNADVIWEKEQMDSKIREIIADMWATGDGCMFGYWDADEDTGQRIMGAPVLGKLHFDRVSGGSVFFGNPNTRNVQKQPYIQILIRDSVYNLKKEAKDHGLTQDDIDKIGSDIDTDVQLGKYKNIELEGGDEKTKKCNAYLTFEREDDGYISWSKSTNGVDIRKKVNLGIKRYPIAWTTWEDVENSYHGRAESTGIHSVQRYVNKMYALCMMWMINNSLGRIVYDETMISGISNEIGSAIPVNGNPSNVIYQLRSGDFNAAILQVIDTVINYMRDFLGVTDAALGQARPDNTSAIIALGKQSALALETQQAHVKQFIEDIYLIIADFMVAKYVDGRRMPVKQNGKITYVPFEASLKDRLLLNVKIEVGASSIWDFVANDQTMDKMLEMQVITPVQYLENVSKGKINGQSKLLAEMKEQQAQQQKAQASSTDNADYEAMAQFFDQLPQEIQIALKSLPPDQMQEALIEMMNIPTEQALDTDTTDLEQIIAQYEVEK